MIAWAVPPFVRGLLIGVAVAAPVGPMSVLCMRRTLTAGPRAGLATGAGIALGDALYGAVAASGVAGIMHFMFAYERPLHLTAGAFLMYLSWRTFRAPATPVGHNLPAASGALPAIAAFSSALLLTLTNPPTIVSFVAIFAALAPAGFRASDAWAMVSGVLAGSLAWWLLVTMLVTVARHALGNRTRMWITRISGALLGVLGAAEIRRAL